jgi:hypothetical protein
MLSIEQLRDQTKLNVIAANNYEATCFWLLIKNDNGTFWKAHYIIGQSIGIQFKGTKKGTAFKRQPKFHGTIY